MRIVIIWREKMFFLWTFRSAAEKTWSTTTPLYSQFNLLRLITGHHLEQKAWSLRHTHLDESLKQFEILGFYFSLRFRTDKKNRILIACCIHNTPHATIVDSLHDMSVAYSSMGYDNDELLEETPFLYTQGAFIYANHIYVCVVGVKYVVSKYLYYESRVV